MNKLLCIMLLLVCIVGCEPKGRVEFVAVVQDHEKLSIEMNNAVIKTIQGDMDNMRFKGTLTPEIELAGNKLIERLELAKKQSQLISKYVQSAYVDEELLSEMLNSIWKGNTNVEKTSKATKTTTVTSENVKVSY